ncbi:uncharacterized protein LOC121274018 isoform X2 [Carcharodon carcharias]|uniref:uncharacterized protein LOC121274018 isoform X2 n=1 Tax=Carcharodon carcharias TaxID=13397 RepID=UPI001B7DCC11|nr:uncharacterized protein LOC121274018 isoform X2 [Carcharodon carcharias]
MGWRCPDPGQSTVSGPQPQVVHAAWSLTVTLLLFIGCLHGALVVIQTPSFVTRLEGQSVSLNCGYTADDEDVFRSVVYWTLKEGKGPTVIHPTPPPRYQNRLTLTKHRGGGNTTLLIHPLQLTDTNLYYCYISFLVGEQSFNKEGAGTRIFVYGPLVLTPPPSCPCDALRGRCHLWCEARVPGRNGAQIVWLRDGVSVGGGGVGGGGGAGTVALTPASDGVHRLSSQLPLPTLSPGTTVNYTCALKHNSAGIIAWKEHVVVSAQTSTLEFLEWKFDIS